MISKTTLSPNLDFPCFIAEFLGVFFLVLLTCYSNITDVNEATNTGIGILLIYTFFTYALAPISGAHLNPAISLSLVIEGKIPAVKGLLYIACQLTGSMLAALLVLALRPLPKQDDENAYWLGQPTVSNFSGTDEPIIGFFALALSELVCSAVLMFIWKCAMLDSKTPNGTYGFIVGAYYGVMAMSLGRINGGSANPARSFGPGLLAADFKHMIFYIFGSFGGAILGGMWYDLYSIDTSKIAKDTDNTGLPVLKPVDISLDDQSELLELSKLE